MNKVFLFSRGREYFFVNKIVAAETSEYVIEEEIGKGGNGVVFKCLDQKTGIEYAIKFLMSEGANANKRYQREIDFLKNIDKQNHIINMIDSGSVEACTKNGKKRIIPFYLMELANEGNLRNHIRLNKDLCFRDYFGQFRGLAAALKHIHEKNYIHRDIKPENILIIGERWVLADFGLIKNLTEEQDITREDEKVGPAFWMSPEAMNKYLGSTGPESSITQVSDVFQLAAVFWYVVNKKHPTGILMGTDWEGDPDLFKILQKALQHNQGSRYRNGEEFFNELIKIAQC